jgi:hypothetical protein
LQEAKDADDLFSQLTRQAGRDKKGEVNEDFSHGLLGLVRKQKPAGL